MDLRQRVFLKEKFLKKNLKVDMSCCFATFLDALDA